MLSYFYKIQLKHFKLSYLWYQICVELLKCFTIDHYSFMQSWWSLVKLNSILNCKEEQLRVASWHACLWDRSVCNMQDLNSEGKGNKGNYLICTWIILMFLQDAKYVGELQWFNFLKIW